MIPEAYADSEAKRSTRGKCASESAGKRKSGRNNKIGNVHLKWAFGEAASLFPRESDRRFLLPVTRKEPTPEPLIGPALFVVFRSAPRRPIRVTDPSGR